MRSIFSLFKWVLSALVLAPIFITIPGFDVLLLRLAGDLPEPGLENAVSVLSIFIAILGFSLLPSIVRAVRAREHLHLAVLSLTLYFLSLATAGAVANADTYPLLGGVQYAFPVAAVAIGHVYQKRYRLNLRRVLILFITLNLVLPSLVFAYFYLVYDTSFGALQAAQVTNRFFYALLSHIPALTVIASIFLLGTTCHRRLLPIASLSVTSSLYIYFITWSRAAVMVAVVSLIVLSIVAGRELVIEPTRRSKTVLMTSIALASAALVVPRLGMIGYRADLTVRPLPQVARTEDEAAPSPPGSEPAAPQASPAPESAGSNPELNESRQGTEPESSLRTSTVSRLWYMREGLRRWSDRPVLGIRFRPDERSLIRRQMVEKKQIFQSHNQYIDILLKSGFVGLALFAMFYLWFIVRPLIAAVRRSPNAGQRLASGTMLAILTGLAVAANFQLYFTVWTTGVPVGFLMGYMVAGAEASLHPARGGSRRALSAQVE